jgi:hypothetical protein
MLQPSDFAILHFEISSAAFHFPHALHSECLVSLTLGEHSRTYGEWNLEWLYPDPNPAA